MGLVLVAIRSGTDPVAPLPPASIHRTLEDPIYCPRCEATYNLIVDYDRSVNKFFEEDSRRHISLLRKAVFVGHSCNHKITHYETNGVIVTSHAKPKPIPSPPMLRHIM